MASVIYYNIITANTFQENFFVQKDKSAIEKVNFTPVVDDPDF